MPLINPCNLSLNASNTGIECQSALSVTAMYIWVPRTRRWTQADIDAAPYNGSFTAFAEAQTLLPPAQRWYPMFGFAAPIVSITENNETDVVETLDNGASVFVRYGKYNRTILTDAGGLCFASHLMRFPNQYSFIEVDQEGKVQVYEPTTGTYAGVPTNMVKGLGPVLATFSTVYKNRLMLSFDPVAYIQQGKIFASDSTENILGLTGLLDTVVAAGTTTQTTTNIYITVKTECAETDLAAEYPGTTDPGLIQLANFIVLNANGTVNTPSAIAIHTTGEIKITGTFATGTNVSVDLNTPVILASNGVSGYESLGPATVAIP